MFHLSKASILSWEGKYQQKRQAGPPSLQSHNHTAPMPSIRKTHISIQKADVKKTDGIQCFVNIILNVKPLHYSSDTFLPNLSSH
jgi:hypothetical protein